MQPHNDLVSEARLSQLADRVRLINRRSQEQARTVTRPEFRTRDRLTGALEVKQADGGAGYVVNLANTKPESLVELTGGSIGLPGYVIQPSD